MYARAISKVLIIGLAISALTSFASANVLDRTDYEHVTSLIRTSDQLNGDLLNVETGTRNLDEKDCLFELIRSVASVRSELHAVRMLVSLSVLMNDNEDEQTVLDELRAEGKEFAWVMEHEREGINKSAGLLFMEVRRVDEVARDLSFLWTNTVNR
jgi:hypothetical protein